MCNCPTPTCPTSWKQSAFYNTIAKFLCKISFTYILYFTPAPPPCCQAFLQKKDECFVTFVRIWPIFVVFGVKNRSGGDCRYPVVGVRQYVDKHGTTFILPQIATLDTLVLSKSTFDNSRITIFPRAKRRCLQPTCIYAPCGRRCDSRKPRRARGKLRTIDKNHVYNQRQSQANFINSSILFNGRNTADMYLPRVPSTSFWEASGKSMLFSRA